MVMNLFNKIKEAFKKVDWKEEIKNIFIEYFILSSIIATIFYFRNDMDNNISFILAMFMIHIRHHHKGEIVILEEFKYCTYTKVIAGRKIFHFLDLPTLAIMLLFLSERTNFYVSLFIFILWFIITDIYRTRKSIYGHYISRWLYTSRININNNKWRMHQADEDPFPSVPHMHAIDKPLKLNVYNGYIYDSKTNKYICRASRKDLSKLWSDSKFKTEVENARIIYKKNNPSYMLEEIPTILTNK